MSTPLSSKKDLKVGDYIWLYNVNHRVYGKEGGGPIYRESWIKTKIDGETSRSFLAGHHKLPKKGNYITSEEELDREVFVNDNAYKIAEEVRYCRDYEKLVTIKNLLSEK